MNGFLLVGLWLKLDSPFLLDLIIDFLGLSSSMLLSEGCVTVINSMDEVLYLDDRLDFLVDKIVNFLGTTFLFKKQACRFRRNVWWKMLNLCMSLILNYRFVPFLLYIVFCSDSHWCCFLTSTLIVLAIMLLFVIDL